MDPMISTTTTTADAATATKLTAFAAAWQSVDQTIQHRLAPPRLTQAISESMGVSVLALCLAPIPQASFAPQKPGEDGEMDAAVASGKDKDGKNRCVRVSFAVLKVLCPGWSWVEGIEGGGGGSGGSSSSGKNNSRDYRRDNNNKGGGGGKEAQIKLSRLLTGHSDHVLMHSFELNKKTYHRGARSHDYIMVSPGMVFTLKGWGDKIPKIFKMHTSGDVAPFDVAIIELSTKSLTCDVKDSMLDIRSFRTVPGLSAASRAIVSSSVAFASMNHAAMMQAHFLAATHLTNNNNNNTTSNNTKRARLDNGGDGGSSNDDANNNNSMEDTKKAEEAAETVVALPPGLSQEWIKGNLSPTISLVRVAPTAGTFAVGPDEILRFHSEGPLVDLPCNTLIVRYDKRQYPSSSSSSMGEGADNTTGASSAAASSMPDPWTVKLFNIAVLAGAVEMLVAVDTYRGRDDTREPSLEAFARIDMTVIANMLLRTTPMSPMPASIAAAFSAQGMAASLKHLAVFPLVPNSTTHHLVLDLRKLVRRAAAAAASAPAAGAADSSPAGNNNNNNNKSPTTTTSTSGVLSAFVPNTGPWERGHNVHIFMEGRLVFHFVAPVHLQGADALNTRVFEAMPIPKLQDLGAEYEEEEMEDEEPAAEVGEETSSTSTATATSAAAASAATNAATANNNSNSATKKGASAAASSSKRKRATEEEAAAAATAVVG